MKLIYPFRIFAALSLILFGSLSAFAQTGSISGTVSDQAGAVVTGAQITVVSAGTGLTRVTTTSDTGTFSVTELPVGVYSIAVAKEGFKTFRVPTAQITVSQTVNVNPK